MSALGQTELSYEEATALLEAIDANNARLAAIDYPPGDPKFNSTFYADTKRARTAFETVAAYEDQVDQMYRRLRAPGPWPVTSRDLNAYQIWEYAILALQDVAEASAEISPSERLRRALTPSGGAVEESTDTGSSWPTILAIGIPALLLGGITLYASRGK